MEEDDKNELRNKKIKDMSNSMGKKATKNTKRSIKFIVKQITKVLATIIKTLLPIIIPIIIILVLLAAIVYFLSLDDINNMTAHGKSSINTVLNISDISELVTINGTPQKGYTLAFVDDIDEKLEKVLKSDKQYEGYGIKEVDTLKKYIKAELVTQLPYLGDGISNKNLPNLDGVDILYEPEETTELLNSMQGVVMIGDSFTEGMKNYLDDGCFYYCKTGVSPSYWLHNINSLEKDKDSVKAVCVLLGVNNPWEISEMKDLINELCKKYPQKPIYVQKVFPLGKKYEGDATQEQIDKFNKKIQEHCKDKENVYWIDTTSGLIDEVGFLISDDGLHPKDYQTLANNIKNKILRVIGESNSSDDELQGSNAKEAIWSYLISKGFSEVATAGIMGNWEQESGYFSNNLQEGSNKKGGISDEEFTNQVNNGTISEDEFVTSSKFGLNDNNEYGYGLAQWTSAGRKRGLYEFAKEEQKDIDDLKMQLDYFMKELENSSYSELLEDSFRNIAGGEDAIIDATVKFHEVYESSSDTREAVESTRGGFAKNVYNELHGTVPSGTYSTSSSKKAIAVTDRDVSKENKFQPAIKLKRVIPNKNIGNMEEANGKVVEMTYVPPGVFNAYLNQNNGNVLEVFTINNNREIVFAKWTYEDGETKYVKASSVDITTVMEKYTMPYDYIMMLNIFGEDVEFALGLADLAINSKYIVAIQDNVTTTYTKTEQEEVVEYTVEAGVDSHGNKVFETMTETNYYESEKQTEKVSDLIELTYADSWAIKVENEVTYLDDKSKEREDVERMSSGPTSTTEENTTTTVTTESITNKYKSGKTTVHENEGGDKFVKLYNKCKNFKLLEPDWLFEGLNSNPKTTKMVDLTKYLLYKATHQSYGVEKPGEVFSQYKDNEFKEIKQKNKGTVGWDFTRAWENNDLRKYMKDNDEIQYDDSSNIYSCVTKDRSKYILHDIIGQTKGNKIYGMEVLSYNVDLGFKWQNLDLFQEQGINIRDSEFNVYGESKIDVEIIENISIKAANKRIERVELLQKIYKVELENYQKDCLADIIYENGNIHKIMQFLKENEFDFEKMTEEELEETKKQFQDNFEEFTRKRGEARWILFSEGRYCTPIAGEELDPSDYFGGNGDILESCEAVTKMLLERGATYPSSNGKIDYNKLNYTRDIKNQLENENEKNFCCATYVAAVLYHSGILTEEQINKYNYHSTVAFVDLLTDAGWDNSIPLSEMQPGDILNKPNDGDRGHIMIYAGDGLFWDQATGVVSSGGSPPSRKPHGNNDLSGYVVWRPK